MLRGLWIASLLVEEAAVQVSATTLVVAVEQVDILRLHPCIYLPVRKL